MPIHKKTFHTNEFVLANGTYEIFHTQHFLASQVVLFKTERFPKCSRCDFPVTFLLHHEVRALDYVNHLDVRVPLTELQPIQLDDSSPDVATQLRDQI
jgi:hypothetical protein